MEKKKCELDIVFIFILFVFVFLNIYNIWKDDMVNFYYIVVVISMM